MTCPLCLLPCAGDSEAFLAPDAVVVAAEIDLHPVDLPAKRLVGAA
jgi:hypothetical protein